MLPDSSLSLMLLLDCSFSSKVFFDGFKDTLGIKSLFCVQSLNTYTLLSPFHDFSIGKYFNSFFALQLQLFSLAEGSCIF